MPPPPPPPPPPSPPLAATHVPPRPRVGPQLGARLRQALEELHATGTLTAALEGALRSSGLDALRAAPSEGRPYGRAPLHHDARGEVMLASWRPGARSAPHDHGGARGLVLVLAGTFEERLFATRAVQPLAGRAFGAPFEVRRWQAGDALHVPAEVVHDMASTAAGGLTLHLYPGEGAPARVYDPEGRCTYLVRGGAWLPPDDVVLREPWGES